MCRNCQGDSTDNFLSTLTRLRPYPSLNSNNLEGNSNNLEEINKYVSNF